MSLDLRVFSYPFNAVYNVPTYSFAFKIYAIIYPFIKRAFRQCVSHTGGGDSEQTGNWRAIRQEWVNVTDWLGCAHGRGGAMRDLQPAVCPPVVDEDSWSGEWF